MIERVILVISMSVGILLFSYLSNRREKQRTQKLRKLARELRCQFLSDRTPFELPKFKLFSKGHSQKAWNSLRRTYADVDMTLFDYKYTTGSGKSSHTYTQTVLLAKMSSDDLPEFVLRPESGLHGIAEFFGAQDINIETHPTFSKHYLLKGSEMSLRHIFSLPLLKFYEHHQGLITEGKGTRLLVYRSEKRPAVKEMETFLEKGRELVELFRIGDQNTRSLLQALQSEQADVRARAARMAGPLRSGEIIPMLITLLDDPDEGVRQAVIWSLGLSGDARLVSHLLPMLSSASGDVHHEIVTALKKLCPKVERVVFAQPPATDYLYDPYTACNPDVSALKPPMNALQELVLDAETHDFHQVERFLTYVLNVSGQKYLKTHIEVHIYGSPDRIQPNLWNTIRNLFPRLHTHAGT